MKSMLKWLTTVVLTILLAAPGSALADTLQSEQAPSQATQAVQHQTTVPSNQANPQHTFYVRGSHHSGYRSPSSAVGGTHFGTQGYSSYGSSRPRFGIGSGFGSHLFSFGAGWFVGRLFNPFGGYGGYGYHSFSFFHLLLDLFIIWIIWRIIRRIFR